MNQNVIYYPRQAIIKTAKKFPTPFFLYDERRWRNNCRRFKTAFEKFFPNFQPLFAVKANSNPTLLQITLEEGFGFDCSSKAEVWLANKLKNKGMHTGNYSTTDELEYVIKKSQLILNLDDINQIETVKKIGPPRIISFRVNPGISRGGMASLYTAGPNAKFGVPFERASEAYTLAKKIGVKHFGIHMMTGSNILDEKYFYNITAKLLEIVAQIKKRTGIEIEFLNIGGGFGVPYKPNENSLNIEKVARYVHQAFKEQCDCFKIKSPRLMAEPGRYISADAGWLIGRVTVIKESYKKFVGLDATSSDLPRPAIYGAYHHATIINSSRKKENVTLVGSICENNDQLARNRLLPKCSAGDLAVIHNAGGHSFAMGHNYNGKPRHAEYLWCLNGKIKQIRSAETIQDLFSHTNLKNLY